MYGPYANILLAFVVYVIIALNGQSSTVPVIGKIIPNSPAFKASLKPGDKILEINNHKIKKWNEIMYYISTNSTKPIDIKIQRNSTIKELTIMPYYLKIENEFGKVKRRIIGIYPKEELQVINMFY